jgi:pre-rRNA-processing protein TSR3
MRSSGSTPSPSPERTVRLLLLFAGEDRPKACTGRRLVARRLAEAVGPGRAPRPAPVLLDPRSNVPLSGRDAAVARRGGLLGVDCSWNRLDQRGGYPDLAPWLSQIPTRRRLPFLLAGNPQHYGRLGELNTAEAMAAGLYLLGEPERARKILSGFGGGEAFFDLNREPLQSYATAADADELLREERSYF